MITLKNQALDGQLLQASFLPLKGMNLVSLKKGDLEIIDQSTINLFEERFAGLGALIGPHFHHRENQQIPLVPFEELFPHIARVKLKGGNEPFSHGIARYAPWNYSSTETTLHAKISGDDTWNGVLLSTLEGFNFEMYMDIELTSQGLTIELSVNAQRPSVCGFHYYYALEGKNNFISAKLLNRCFDGKKLYRLPESWVCNENLHLAVEGSLDHGFYPLQADQPTTIVLHKNSHQVEITYQSHTEESSFQIYHPDGTSYVCIEPLSANFPRQPELNSSGVTLHIRIQ